MAVAGSIEIELKAVDGGYRATLKEAGVALRQLQIASDSTAKSVKRLEDAQLSLSTKFRNLVLMLGNLRFAAMDLYDVFLRLPASIAQTAGELERTQALLTGLSKELSRTAREAEGAMNFDYLTKMAQTAPFSIGALSNAFVKFKSAGIDPTNGSLKTLVDAVARFGGTNETLGRASVAIQQMAGKGVISMEELRQQLGEAVPTAMQSMATGMEMSMSKLAAAIGKGTVEAKQALLRMFVVMNLESRGAAAEMMNTWVGMLANLKTRWELTAKTIFDAGFGDSLKRAVDSIGKGISTNEFQRFAVSVGQSLETAVQWITAAGQKVVEFAEILKNAAVAFGAYKIAASLITPVLESGGATYKKLNSERARLDKEVLDGIRAQQETAKAAAKFALEDANAKVAASQKVMAARQAELDFLRAMDAQQQSIMRGQKQKTSDVYSIDGAGKITNLTAEANKQVVALQRINAANEQMRASTARALDEAKTKHQQAVAEATKHAQALVAIERGADAGAAGISRLSKAANAAQVAFNALGGWVTVFNLALSAGIYFWATWESAADKAAKAAQRALNAKRGISSEEDYQKTNSEMARAAADMQRARQALTSAEERGWNLPEASQNSRNEYAKLKAVFEKASADYTRLAQESAAHRNAIDKRVGEERAEAYSKPIQDQIDTIYSNARASKLALDTATEQEVKAAGTNQKRIAEAMEKNGQKTKEIARQAALGRQKALRDALSQFDPKNMDEANQSMIKRLQADLIDAGREVQNANEAMKKFVFNQPKDEGATPESPIKSLLTRLEADNAGLREQINGLTQNGADLDKAAGAAAEIRKKFELGGFKFGKNDSLNATPEQVKKAEEAARTNELLKRQAADAQKFADFMEGIAPRYQEALEILVNPLGEQADGRASRQFDKLFESLKNNPERLQKVAEALKVPLDQLKETGSKQAAFIDFAPIYQKMVQDTAQMNNSIVEDNRESARKRKEAEDIVFSDFMKKQIAKLEAAGATEAEIARIQAALAANMDARGRDNAQRFASPLEKLEAEWKKTTTNMEEATARWTTSATDAIAEMVMNGKADFGSLTKSILADILKIEIRARLGNAIGTLMKGIGSFFFADGGVMSAMGSVPLKKYAAGGVATSPQMAIFGEGDMAEAYVPLPDGRRIPVALQGSMNSGGGNVVVNVVNQTSQPVNAAQGQPRFDGKQMVLDVVLTAAAQPGPFRDGLKNVVQGMS